MLLISFTLTLELQVTKICFSLVHTVQVFKAKENLMIQNCVQGWSILESNQIDPAYALPVDVINWILLTK